MNKNTQTQPFTEDLELKLYSYYKHFRLYGSTYMYYTINDPIKGRLRFSTDENWIKIYLEDSLIENDPIKGVCDQKKNRIVSWKNIIISNRAQKRTMDARNSFGIYNGVNIINHDRATGLQKVLALCTDCKSYNLSHELIENDGSFKDNIVKIFSLI